MKCKIEINIKYNKINLLNEQQRTIMQLGQRTQNSIGAGWSGGEILCYGLIVTELN